MNLPFFKEKRETSEYYLALILTDEKAESIILQVSLGKLTMLSRHEELFPASIEDVSLDEFIAVIDKSVSKAEEILPPDVQTHKTVFGVKESWIEEETKKIKKDYLNKLKKMCDSLDLSPVGFMVTSEAITHLLQDEEGAPISAIVAEIEKQQVTLRLMRGGKTLEATSGPLHGKLPATVDLLLKHFTVPVLPARIILLHPAKAEKLSQQFITHQWSRSLPFLHVPQVTMLPTGFEARAVTYGAAAQMGFEVIETGEKTAIQEITEPEESEEPKEPVDKEAIGETETNAVEDEAEPNAETFGFVREQEIAEVKQHPTSHKAHQPHHPHKEEAVHHHTKPSHHEYDENLHNIILPEEDFPVTQEEKSPKASPLALLRAPRSFGGVGAYLSPLKLFSHIRFPSLGNLPAKGGLLKIGIPVGLLLLLLVGGYLFYLYQTKIQITLTAQPKAVDQAEDITFSTASPSDFSKKLLAAHAISATVDGELSRDVTGKKEIGDKAKGTVTIINKDFSKKQLDSGTVVTSSNNLDFALDKDVTIASASGDDSGIKFGTADVSVTAKAIGTESNLPSNTKFTVGGSSTLTAKNNSAFSGGTKKSVTAVSKDDLAKLRADLPKSLEDKAKDELSKKTTGDTTALPLLLNPTLEKESFDKKLGDEAKKVKISAKVVFDGISYQNAELTTYAKEILKKRFSDDVSYAENSIKEEITDIKQKSSKEINAKVKVSAGLLPKIDTQDIAQKLQGKSYTQAQEILTSLPQISNSQMTFSPAIPFLPKLLPQLPKHITVEIKNE